MLNNERKMSDSVFSKRIKAGKKRTYFFDVRSTVGNDYYLTITESRRRIDGEGYDRHKIFIYKEDFNKFIKGLIETVDHVKTVLMPNFDFDAFNHEYDEAGESLDTRPRTIESTSGRSTVQEPMPPTMPTTIQGNTREDVDRW